MKKLGLSIPAAKSKIAQINRLNLLYFVPLLRLWRAMPLKITKIAYDTYRYD